MEFIVFRVSVHISVNRLYPLRLNGLIGPKTKSKTANSCSIYNTAEKKYLQREQNITDPC